MLPRYHAKALLRYQATVLLCCHAATLPRYHAAALPRYRLVSSQRTLMIMMMFNSRRNRTMFFIINVGISEDVSDLDQKRFFVKTHKS